MHSNKDILEQQAVFEHNSLAKLQAYVSGGKRIKVGCSFKHNDLVIHNGSVLESTFLFFGGSSILGSHETVTLHSYFIFNSFKEGCPSA